MTTHAFGRGSHVEARVWHGLSAHWAWWLERFSAEECAAMARAIWG